MHKDGNGQLEVNINRFTLGSEKKQTGLANPESVDTIITKKQTESSGEDRVDAISEAAKKLMDDPNSYYHTLIKEDKSKHSTPVSNSNKEPKNSSEHSTPELGTQKNNKILSFSTPSMIEPFSKKKVPEPSKEPSKSKQTEGEKTSIEGIPDKPNEIKERVSVSEVLKNRPKKVRKDEPKAPEPKYQPLPCLDCKNIQSICEVLNIEKIDEVVELVNSIQHGKFIRIIRRERAQAAKRGEPRILPGAQKTQERV